MIREGKTNKLEEVDINEVIEWINTVHDFCIEVLTLAKKSIFVPKIMDRIREENLQAIEQDIIRAISISSEFK